MADEKEVKDVFPERHLVCDYNGALAGCHSLHCPVHSALKNALAERDRLREALKGGFEMLCDLRGDVGHFMSVGQAREVERIIDNHSAILDETKGKPND